MKRTGILGGAFNPPHQGHLRLAELALNQLELDEVRFIPTARSPHKAAAEGSPNDQARLGLLQAALAGFCGACRIETLELERGGASYTVDTLEALSQREPEACWILLLGSDQLAGLSAWRRMDRVLELASLAISPRPGFDPALPAPFAARERDRWSGAPGEIVWLSGTELDLASSRLRERLRDGETCAGISSQVAAVIHRENYYR